MSNEFFYFSKSDRRACVVLLIIIVLSLFSKHLIDKNFELFPIVQTDTITWQQENKSNDNGGYTYSKSKSSDYYKRNNNTTYQKSNGSSSDNKGNYYDGKRNNYYDNQKKGMSLKDSALYSDSVYRKRTEFPSKLAFGTLVDINTADTTLLKRIPGIGSYFARRIVEYRSSLGGYTNVTQLSEIKNLPDSVQGWFILGDSINTIRIEVNKSSIQKLMEHPYISFYQARAIIQYRQAHGDIPSESQLAMLSEFSDADIKRLSPYLKY